MSTVLDFDLSQDEVFILDEIAEVESKDRLYCLSVESKEHTFLIEGGIPTCNSDEDKEADKLKSEARTIIGSIARLGRAAGVHVFTATQRPDAELIPGETKANLSTRICCGRTDSTASSMILDNSNGTMVRSFPKGRIFVQTHKEGRHAQGFFASPEWYDEYLESNKLEGRGETSLDGYSASEKKDKPKEWDEDDQEIYDAFSWEED